MNTVGRKPFVFNAIEDFINQNNQVDFSQNSIMDSYRTYQDWSETQGKKAISYVSFSHAFKTPDAPIKKESALTLDEQFETLEENVTFVLKGYLKALYIYGEPGIGKTRTVEKMLSKEKEEFVYFSGGVRGTFELVKILHENKDNKILIFDDFDSVFRTKTQLDILKKALVDSESRLITWVDATKRGKDNRLPEKFEFTSSIIFISNRSRLDPAMKSRCKIMSFNATKIQVLNFIHKNLDKYLIKIPMAYKQEVYEFLRDNIASIPRVDFRFFKNATMDYLSDVEKNRTDGTWKKKIMNNLM
jgi:hypothetical protein